MSLHDIEQLFAARGAEQYSGEPVTQLQHALQCAALAEADGASDALVTAALLHDLGHLLHTLGDTPTLRGQDDAHQTRALPFLRDLFAEPVLAPIRLHVDAKRYLCAMEPGYEKCLSADSLRSLALQGGAFGVAQVHAFAALAGAEDAVRLRRWDDRAKVAHAQTPTLGHYLARASACVLSRPSA